VLRKCALAVPVVLLVVGLVACGDDASQKTKGPYAVGTRQVSWVDKSRETPAYGGAPALPDRTLVTDIWYPAEGDPNAAAAPDAPNADGPFPVVVFNHGQQGEPAQYALSFESWARAGYVVVAPRHPISVRGGPGGQFVDDFYGEIGDIPFVIDAIDQELSDIADVDHLAVAGHSSGAIAAYGVGFNTCCHDDRVDAVLVEGLMNIPLDGEYSDDLKGTAVLFMAGDADPAYPEGHAIFEGADSPKYFLTIPGGDHSLIYRDAVAWPTVANAALAFFDRHLKDRDDAGDALKQVPGIEADP